MLAYPCEQKNVNRNNFSQKESLSFSVLDAYIILTSGSTKKYYLVMVIKLIQKTPTIRLIFFFKKSQSECIFANL